MLKRKAGRKPDLAGRAEKRTLLLEKGYEIFVEYGIAGISLNTVAEAAGFGIATIYRYFDKKQGFVVEIATKKWQEFTGEILRHRPREDSESVTAVEMFEFYLDSFLQLYRDHKDLLRFNQMFNIYVQSEGIDAATLKPYNDMADRLAEQFHITYERAKKDRTIRTDIPETELFSTTLHIMLAAVTRYAGGLVYMPEDFDDMKELETLKNMIMAQYKAT